MIRDSVLLFVFFFQANGFNFFQPGAARFKTRRFNFPEAVVTRFKSGRGTLSLKIRHSILQNQEFKSSKAGATYLKIGSFHFSKGGATRLKKRRFQFFKSRRFTPQCRLRRSVIVFFQEPALRASKPPMAASNFQSRRFAPPKPCLLFAEKKEA